MIVLRAVLLLLLGVLLPVTPTDAGYAWGFRTANDISQRIERDLTQLVERVSYSPFGAVRHHPDLNGDGAVESADQALLSQNWGNPGIGDLNQDGVVDFQDISLLAGQWTSTPHPAGTLSTDGNTIGFTAHIYDVESGLLLARFRVYDAALGRWLSPDPAGFVDGMNLYLYVRGNPLVWWDPMGLAPMPTGTRATWASDNEVHFSLHNPQGGGEAVLRMRRICEKDGGNRWLLESADGLSWHAGRTLLEWAVENWGESGRLDYGQDFRNQLARMLDPQATEADHTQRQINEARAQAAEDLQPFIDALRTGGEIGIGLVPGGGLAVFLGTPNLMNAAAMIPVGGAVTKVIGGAARGVRGLDDLSRAAGAVDRNGLTVAGRALQKHSEGNRVVTAFPRVAESAASRNSAAQSIVDDILTAPGTTFTNRTTGRFGEVLDVVAADGRGVRFGSDGRFIGFLEPPR